MSKKLLQRKKTEPSIPVYTGLKHSEKICFHLFKYNQEDFFEDNNISEKNFQGFPKKNYTYWLNIHGIHDLAIQDILDINQRPKFQPFNDYGFFSLKSVLPTEINDIKFEQLSFILGKNYLISFQEIKAKYFEHVRERIRKNIGIVRERRTDYLLFIILESILDNYFITLNNIDTQIEKLNIIDSEINYSPDTIKLIELYKRQNHQIRKTINPIKEFIVKIEREQFGLIDNKNIKYYSELNDMCLSLIDTCEQNEIRLESNANILFSIQGDRMNKVIKILTIVSTIFIPLTFITGVYGMNFKYFPELNWKWGYLSVWIIISMIFLGMLIYFKRKKWF